MHEFGHHIDFNYGAMWPGNTMTSAQRIHRLSSSASGSGLDALRQAAWPDIPSTLYGKSNEAEWFAEVFACQLIPNYRTQDETATDAGAMLFYQLCGMNVDRAKAVRAIFKSLLPMPRTFAYD